MNTDPNVPLKDLVVSNAGARVLERYHLDYCCGGDQTIAAACAAAGHDLQEVLTALDQAVAASGAENVPTFRSAGELIQYIIDTHHTYTRSELRRIETLLPTIIERHGAAHPELKAVAACFDALQADLGPHLIKEEQVLFPFIQELERYRRGERPDRPACCFGAIDNPIRQMTTEHQTVGEVLKRIRHLTDDFTIPADGCATHRSAYLALEGLELDLMRHIHLENYVLFPRAQQLAAGS